MANNIPSIYYRYFIYSADEESMLRKIHGNNLRLGSVVVRGVPKQYTSIVTDPNTSNPDSIVITKGDIRKLKYTPMTKN